MMSQFIKRSITLLVILTVTISIPLFTGPAIGAVINVNSTSDELTTNGSCSLREAIINANDDAATYPDCVTGSGADTINLPVGTYTLSPLLAGTGEDACATGDLDITDELTITGAGQATTIIEAGTTDANGIDRVFHILANTSATTFNSMTIQHGRLTSGSGGGIYCMSGDLTLDNSRVEYNECDNNGGGIFIGYTAVAYFSDSHISHNESTDHNGGGIYLYNSSDDFDIDLHLSHCTLDNNTADDSGGAIFSSYEYKSKMVMDDCVVSNNRATNEDGGAIFWDDDGEVQINRSSFFGNIAGGDGGAIDNDDPDDPGCVIVDSVFYNNTAADNGGAINSVGDLFITQCTISGNTATNGDGGGIYNRTSLELRHVTIADNHANNGSGGGIYNLNSSFSVMEHTILGNNAANACPDFYSDQTTIASEQYNLIENDTDCGTFDPTSASTTDIFGQDPLLDPLTDNGGPTQTHALQDGSPAIDVGDPSFSDFQYDQRLNPFLRVIAGTIDIGAYESGNVDPIPTMNEWGMLILALLISGSAVWSLRRKRKEL